MSWFDSPPQPAGPLPAPRDAGEPSRSCRNQDVVLLPRPSFALPHPREENRHFAQMKMPWGAGSQGAHGVGRERRPTPSWHGRASRWWKRPLLGSGSSLDVRRLPGTFSDPEFCRVKSCTPQEHYREAAKRYGSKGGRGGAVRWPGLCPPGSRSRQGPAHPRPGPGLCTAGV